MTMTRRELLAVPFLAAGATACLDGVEARVVEMVNEERGRRGLARLRVDETLRTVARNHDDDMLARGFFSHQNPSGEGPAERIERQHRRLIAVTGENIWESSGEIAAQHADLAAEMMKGWMNSAGHRENILRAEFTDVGVGVCAAGREIRATQDFANTQCLLARPLPAVARTGTAVDLATTGGRAAELFDIWSKRNGRAVTRPAPIPGAKLAAPPGVYVVRFYFANGPGRYTIFEGPSVEIR